MALVPLLLALENQSVRRTFAYAWLQGSAFYVVTLYWVELMLRRFGQKTPTAAVFEMLLLGGFEGLAMAVTLMLAAFAGRRTRVPMLVTLTIAWPAIEWLRTFFPFPFPWAFTGYTAYRDLRLIQFSEFTGVYGVSALIVAANVAAYQLIFGSQALRARLRDSAIVIGMIFAALVFGSLRISQLDRAPAAGKLKVAMVQGNILESAKWDPAEVVSRFKVYVDESEAAALQHPDLIIWPETAANFYIAPDRFFKNREQLLRLARDIRIPLLVGTMAVHSGREDTIFNRACLISAEGQVVANYDKNMLVAFAEYLPLKSVFGNYFHAFSDKTSADYMPGDRQTIFNVSGTRFAVLICYESLFPDLARRAVKAGAEILINIENDAWSDRSAQPYQSLAMASMRAVETHTPMVRVNNTGISAVITPVGRITDATALFVRTTEIETVEWKNVRTFYTRRGDVFAKICFGLGMVLLLAACLRGGAA